jgi:uncharacterized protein (TIGR03083 family)
MDTDRLRDCLDTDFHRLREAAVGADLAAPVPSCPGWSMADLVRHVGAVYLHKVECMRLGSHPEPWPPEGLNDEPPIDLIERGYALLTAEFANRRPDEPSFTWFGPDQTVGFWIRRMAQETVIHRVDAELGAGVAIAAIPADLAEDGIDELLVAFVEYATATWPDEFTELLAGADDRTVRVATPGRTWLLRLTSKEVRVQPSDVEAPDAVATGPVDDMLLWLWNRGGESGVTVTGDTDVINRFRQVLAASTQ